MAEYVLGWFTSTHRLAREGFGVNWQRVALPAAGGVGDQDAWLFDALEYARHVHEEILQDDLDRANARRDRT